MAANKAANTENMSTAIDARKSAHGTLKYRWRSGSASAIDDAEKCWTVARNGDERSNYGGALMRHGSPHLDSVRLGCATASEEKHHIAEAATRPVSVYRLR